MAAHPAAETAAWSHPRAAFPESVHVELARRREQILARAEGRVLDLDDPAVAARFASCGRTRLAPVGAAAPGGADGDGRYETVVATGVLAAFADLGSITRALADLVALDGALLVVEPVARPGWTSVVRTTLPDPRHRGAPWRALHLDRDVPAAVRAAGLVICDLDRIELPAQPPSLRHWISARAVRISPA